MSKLVIVFCQKHSTIFARHKSLYLNVYFLPNDIQWSRFGLVVDSADIFSNDTKADQLNATKEKNRYYKGCPTRDSSFEFDLGVQCVDNVSEGKYRNNPSE